MRKRNEKRKGMGKELIFKESRLSLQLTLNSSHILFCKKQNKKIMSIIKKIHEYLYLKKNYCTEEKIYT